MVPQCHHTARVINVLLTAHQEVTDGCHVSCVLTDPGSGSGDGDGECFLFGFPLRGNFKISFPVAVLLNVRHKRAVQNRVTAEARTRPSGAFEDRVVSGKASVSEEQIDIFCRADKFGNRDILRPSVSADHSVCCLIWLLGGFNWRGSPERRCLHHLHVEGGLGPVIPPQATCRER